MRKKISSWNTQDAKIKSRILGSIEPHLILNLEPYKTAKDMWEYLHKVYNQHNSAYQFHLECKIAQYVQGTLSQECYSGFCTLWSEYDNNKYANVYDDAVLTLIQGLQASSQMDQCLMKENVRSALMSRVLLPTLDDCLNEFLREEHLLLTKVHLEQQNIGNYTVAYSAKGKPLKNSTREIMFPHTLPKESKVHIINYAKLHLHMLILTCLVCCALYT